MRKNDVQALLDHAANDLSDSDLKNIEAKYAEALTSKAIPSDLQIDVKNFMENLRSALDYMAHDIYEAVIKPVRATSGQKDPKDIYFPYGKDENGFKSGIGAALPDLKNINATVFDLLEAVQPHKCGDDWLYQFCRIVNEKKHDALTPQTRTETQTMTASAGGASVTLPINSPNFSVQQGEGAQVFIGGVPVRLSNQGIQPLAPGLQRTITTWVTFEFSGTGIAVLPLMKKALEKISELSRNVYAAI